MRVSSFKQRANNQSSKRVVEQPPKISVFKAVVAVLVVLFIFFQFRLWVGHGSHAELHSLKQQLAEAKTDVAKARQRNNALAAEIDSLKENDDALEERARTMMGMVKKGEHFYRTIEPPATPPAPSSQK